MPQDGLGLAGPLNGTGAPRETDTALAAAETRARAPAAAKPAKKPDSGGRGGIPQFKDNPLGAIGVILQQVAAGFQGKEGPVERAQADEIARQGMQMRAAALGLDAIDTVARTLPSLKPAEMDAFIEGLPDVPGIDLKAMARAAKDGQLEGLEDTVAGLRADPAAMMFLSDVDLSGKSPAEVKKMADDVLAFKREIAGARAKEKIKDEFVAKFSEPARTDDGLLVQFNLKTGERKVLDQERDEFSDPYRDADGDLVQRNLKTNAIKVLSTPGKTDADIRAREEAKRAGQESAPIDAFTATLLDLPSGMTVAQARERGVQVPSEPERKRIQDLESSGKQAIKLTGDIRARIKADPQSITAGGDIASMVNQLRANVQGAADVMGLDIDLSGALGKYEDTFKKHGVATDVMKSLVIDLSYIQAASRGQTGRGLSDKDVERFAKIIGSNRADPEVLTAILDTLDERFDEAFRATAESVTRRRPASLLPYVREAEAILGRASQGEAVSDEELKALSPKARALAIRRLQGNG